MNKFLFVLSFIVIQNAFSHIVQNDISKKADLKFSFEEVCSFLTKRASPLIEVNNINELDCMGEKVRVGKFCAEKLKTDPYYLSGFVDTKEKKVICRSGHEVILKYRCTSKIDEYCKDKDIGCSLLQEKFANRLKISHAALLLEKGGQSELHCIYSPRDIKPLN